jgi:hypothetical protein
MIQLDNISVMNFENAIRGMRNPLNSWDRSDSDFSCQSCAGCYYENDGNRSEADGVVDVWCNHTALRIGEKDLELAMKLANAGSDDRKFLRQIIVSVDITAPLYWWKEFDTYKVGTVANSCSTMHKIHAKEFTVDDFSHEHLTESSKQLLEAIIDLLNYNRKLFVETKNKTFWHQMIQILPTSYNQLRTVTLNYEVLHNMYHARKNHKLDEWRELCKHIEALPYSQLITGERGNRCEKN